MKLEILRRQCLTISIYETLIIHYKPFLTFFLEEPFLTVLTVTKKAKNIM
jgi:hypothetical protein